MKNLVSKCSLFYFVPFSVWLSWLCSVAISTILHKTRNSVTWKVVWLLQNVFMGEGQGGVSSRVHEQQFCVSRLTKQMFTFSRFSKIEVVQNVKNAMTWAGSGRDLGLSEVAATCIWRNIRLSRLFF